MVLDIKGFTVLIEQTDFSIVAEGNKFTNFGKRHTRKAYEGKKAYCQEYTIFSTSLNNSQLGQMIPEYKNKVTFQKIINQVGGLPGCG